MADPNDNNLRQADGDDAPLDPALAARLRLAEAELRGHMDAGIWTPRRILALVVIVVAAIIIGLAVLFFSSMVGRHG